MGAWNAPSNEVAPLLTDTESRRLLLLAGQGDRQAREIMINRNLRLVTAMTRRFGSGNYDAEELFQIGCIGLIKAIDHFDPSYDVKFSTYAVPLILGEIRRFLRDDGPVSVSRGLKETAARVARQKEIMVQASGREPTVSEIAAALGLANDEIVAALEAAQPPLSLDAVVYQDDGDPVYLLDRVGAAAEAVSAGIDRLTLRQVLGQLPERLREVIVLRFFGELKQADIAKRLGVSQVQVSRLEQQALKQLRQILADTL